MLFSPLSNPKSNAWNRNNSRIEKSNKSLGKGKYRRGKLLHTLPIQKGKMIAYNSMDFFENFNIY